MTQPNEPTKGQPSEEDLNALDVTDFEAAQINRIAQPLVAVLEGAAHVHGVVGVHQPQPVGAADPDDAVQRGRGPAGLVERRPGREHVAGVEADAGTGMEVERRLGTTMGSLPMSDDLTAARLAALLVERIAAPGAPNDAGPADAAGGAP